MRLINLMAVCMGMMASSIWVSDSYAACTVSVTGTATDVNYDFIKGVSAKMGISISITDVQDCKVSYGSIIAYGTSANLTTPVQRSTLEFKPANTSSSVDDLGLYYIGGGVSANTMGIPNIVINTDDLRDNTTENRIQAVIGELVFTVPAGRYTIFPENINIQFTGYSCTGAQSIGPNDDGDLTFDRSGLTTCSTTTPLFTGSGSTGRFAISYVDAIALAWADTATVDDDGNYNGYLSVDAGDRVLDFGELSSTDGEETVTTGTLNVHANNRWSITSIASKNSGALFHSTVATILENGGEVGSDLTIPYQMSFKEVVPSTGNEIELWPAGDYAVWSGDTAYDGSPRVDASDYSQTPTPPVTKGYQFSFTLPKNAATGKLSGDYADTITITIDLVTA